MNPVDGPNPGGDNPTSTGGGDTEPMGFNPFRQQRRSTGDYVMVAVALAVCVLLVAWAFLG